ncbi:MAG: diheme cytochrome c precursor [Bradymonadaceae bacterium]
MNGQPNGRGLHVFMAVVVGLAVIGFFVGTRGDLFKSLSQKGYSDESRSEQEVLPARSYRDLMEESFSKSDKRSGGLANLSGEKPDLFEIHQPTEAEYARALAERKERRAYDGAPPTIPHPIRETGAVECMACHGEGLVIDGQRAPAMSHEYMANCTQCHVLADGPFGWAEHSPEKLLLDNAFEGKAGPGPGEVAYEGAPPTIPHPTLMRTDCASCHGVTGHPGLRTTHPWRTQCTQCHGPSATMDQRPEQWLAPFWEEP